MRASERRSPRTRSSARSSRRAVAVEDENGCYEDGPRQQNSLSNEQTLWLISGGVLVFLLFIGFICMGGDSNPAMGSHIQDHPQISNLERQKELVEKHPDNRAYRRELVRLLMAKRAYIEAYAHLQKLMGQNDIRVYTRAVECAFALGRKDDAERFFEKAKSFAPTRVEPIKKIFADELRKVPGGEETQAKTFPGVREAVENLMKGESCYKQGVNDNEKFREAALLLRKAIEVLEKAQEEFPYNQWIERRIVFGNKYLMWSNKMYRGNKNLMEE